MELKLTKSMTCRVAAKGPWGNRAAAFMGLSFFLRMVYYFGLRNLNDVPLYEVVFGVVLQLAFSVAFILALKLPNLNQSRIICGLAAGSAVCYALTAQPTVQGIVCDVLVLGLGALIMLACEGFIPDRKWLLWAAMGTIVFRVLFVDLFGYILPLNELRIGAYLPQCSNLFEATAIATLAPALRLRKISAEE